jgi:hypothetical protein
MRSCLVQLLVLVALVCGLLWFGLPIGAAWLATNALRTAGFTGTDTSVTVTANPPLVLLTGHADAIHVTSNAVSISDLHAASIDVTLGKVDLIGRTIGTVGGTLSGVSIAVTHGNPITAERVTLKGSAAATQATLKLSPAQAQALAVAQLAAQGLTAAVALTAPNRVTIRVAGKTVAAHLEATDGILLLVPDAPGVPIVPLISPGPGNPFRVTGASIAADGVTLTGTVDLASMLGI